jgi:hypothetical protein
MAAYAVQSDTYPKSAFKSRVDRGRVRITQGAAFFKHEPSCEAYVMRSPVSKSPLCYGASFLPNLHVQHVGRCLKCVHPPPLRRHEGSRRFRSPLRGLRTRRHYHFDLNATPVPRTASTSGHMSKPSQTETPRRLGARMGRHINPAPSGYVRHSSNDPPDHRGRRRKIGLQRRAAMSGSERRYRGLRAETCGCD